MEILKDKKARKLIDAMRETCFVDWKETNRRINKIESDLKMLVAELGYEFKDIYASRILQRKEKK